MRNKHFKQMIASVTGGEWVPDRVSKPQLHHFITELFGGYVSGQVGRYHSTASLTAEQMETTSDKI